VAGTTRSARLRLPSSASHPRKPSPRCFQSCSDPTNPTVRKLAFQMAPPDSFTIDQLEAGGKDPDGWVRAAVAVAGTTRNDRWAPSEGLLRDLWQSGVDADRAAAVWAAAFTGDHTTVSEAMEAAIRVFDSSRYAALPKQKGETEGIAVALIACLRDDDIEVRREALRQAVRWARPPTSTSRMPKLSDGLSERTTGTSGVWPSEAMAPCRGCVDVTLPLLVAQDEAASATIEALIRTAGQTFFQRARVHLEAQRPTRCTPQGCRPGTV